MGWEKGVVYLKQPLTGSPITQNALGGTVGRKRRIVSICCHRKANTFPIKFAQLVNMYELYSLQTDSKQFAIPSKPQ